MFRQMVGAARFELATPWSQTRCATRLRHAPISDWTALYYGFGSYDASQNFLKVRNISRNAGRSALSDCEPRVTQFHTRLQAKEIRLARIDFQNIPHRPAR